MRAGWRPATHIYQDLVAAHLTPATRTLDLGCGRGGVMERLHPRAGFVAGLDPDLRSLRDHRAPALALACGLAEALPYADGTFDLVCCSWVLEHLPDPARALAEVARVLTPGGRFIFLTPNARHPLVTLNRALRRSRGRLVGYLYDRPEAETFPAFYRANTSARIERLAEAAGLERVSLRFVADPTYLAFNEALFRLACLLERVTPRWMRVHLVGEYAAGYSDWGCRITRSSHVTKYSLPAASAPSRNWHNYTRFVVNGKVAFGRPFSVHHCFGWPAY
nr:class I SAM-dependent methyltransferase [Anaerolineae bacterium]